jgi:hypothetical protein
MQTRFYGGRGADAFTFRYTEFELAMRHSFERKRNDLKVRCIDYN